MGIEPTRAVWDTNKEWPLTAIGCSSLKDRSWPLCDLGECLHRRGRRTSDSSTVSAGKGHFVSVTATDLPLAPDRPVMPTRTMRYFALASIFTRSVR